MKEKKDVDLNDHPEEKVIETPEKDLFRKLRIGPATRKSLITGGYDTIEKLAYAKVNELSSIHGISPTTAKQIVKVARQLRGSSFKKGSIRLKERKRIKRISTGSKALDRLLGGGVEIGAITEFVGEYRTGKTQLCHTLSVNIQKPPGEGGLGKKIIWIDTERTWRASRTEQIAQSFGMDPDEVLDNLLICMPQNSKEQMAMTEEALEIVEEENVGLIVVDSLIACFRSNYLGPGTLALRQQLLGEYLDTISRQIGHLGIAVVVTNQVKANFNLAFDDPNVPVGGNVVAHATTHRVVLRKEFGNTRSAELVDSAVYAPGKVTFAITESGIVDVEQY